MREPLGDWGRYGWSVSRSINYISKVYLNLEICFKIHGVLCIDNSDQQNYLTWNTFFLCSIWCMINKKCMVLTGSCLVSEGLTFGACTHCSRNRSKGSVRRFTGAMAVRIKSHSSSALELSISIHQDINKHSPHVMCMIQWNCLHCKYQISSWIWVFPRCSKFCLRFPRKFIWKKTQLNLVS